MSRICVVYHAECLDGFGAAWTAWQKFGTKAEYWPVIPQQLPPTSFKNKEVFLFDVSYRAPLLKEIIKIARNLTVIDHHRTAEADIKKFAPRFSFDLNHSAAVLSWRFFNPKKSVPKLLKHIEDVDLWRFKMAGTKELAAWLEFAKKDFRQWSRLARLMEGGQSRKKIIREGKIFLRYQTQLVDFLAKQAVGTIFAGWRCLTVNSFLFHSEIGAALVKKKPPLGIVWHEAGGWQYVSLRSNGSVDVSKIAEKFGGGGHKRAAGFRLPVNKPLPWKRL